jgi:hypothetical protein
MKLVLDRLADKVDGFADRIFLRTKVRTTNRFCYGNRSQKILTPLKNQFFKHKYRIEPLNPQKTGLLDLLRLTLNPIPALHPLPSQDSLSS